jgi:hypothetical protein
MAGVQTVVDQMWDNEEDKKTAVAVKCNDHSISNNPKKDSTLDRGIRPSGPPNPARQWPGMEAPALVTSREPQRAAGVNT